MMYDIQDLKKSAKEYTVLCVDDEERSRTELGGLLDLLFKNVLSAKNGKEALDIYHNNKENIDIVFTDLNMPKMDGFEFTKKIKEIDPLQYVVIISARQECEMFKTIIDLGANGLIVKPVISDKLIKVLQKGLTYLEQLKRLKTDDLSPHDICRSISVTDPAIFIDHITGINSKAKLDKHLLTNNEFNLILINLDNFDHINCKYGYNVGDQVLLGVAKLLQGLLNKPCKLFRLVSDEFVFLLSRDELDLVEKLSKEIISTFNSTKIKTDVEEFDLSCTIGISFGKGQDLLRQAHMAVRESREIGKQKYNYFSNNSKIMQKKEDNLKWLKKIKKALKEDSVIPYYQPIINNKSGEIVKYESLARIMEINRIVKPYYFLENAKLFNMVPNITKLMVSKVFKYMAGKDTAFSINITQDDLIDEEFIFFILKASEKHNIKKENITFEFLENITASKDKRMIENLKNLKKEGFKLAVDDFGSHESSIKTLYNLKVDYIKIDGVFIENLLVDKKSRKIVESIIKLARSIDAKTIAESVSDPEIQKRVKEMGCDYSQGYFIGKPKEGIL